MPSGVQIVVYCEDLQTRIFVRKVLIELGYDPYRVRLHNTPPGTAGAADAWVLEQVPGQVRAHRARAARTRTVLLHIDADKNSVAQRKQAVDQRLVDSGQAARGAGEPIALLVPKRNIETWIHFFLSGPPVDERIAYPRFRGEESRAHPAAEAFAAAVRGGAPPAGAPPSLLDGILEASRVA